MKFSKLTVTVQGNPVSFNAYDRGANGAFVYRKEGTSIYAPRVIVSTINNDAASDKMTVQYNVPVITVPAEGCCDPVSQVGTNLVKTEMRFLASTSQSDRVAAIDTHIALLQELRSTVEEREVIYA